MPSSLFGLFVLVCVEIKLLTFNVVDRSSIEFRYHYAFNDDTNSNAMKSLLGSSFIGSVNQVY